MLLFSLLLLHTLRLVERELLLGVVSTNVMPLEVWLTPTFMLSCTLALLLFILLLLKLLVIVFDGFLFEVNLLLLILLLT